MRWPVVITGGVIAATLTGAPAMAYDICADLADCQRKADAQIKAGQFDQALEALVAVADLATAARDDQRFIAALMSLVSVNLELGRPLVAHAWARAALLRFERSPDALAILEVVRQALPAPPLTDGIEGTYRAYAGYGYWSDLKIRELAPGEVRTEWFMVRYGAVPSAWDYGPAAIWELSADGSYSNGDLIITYEGSEGSVCELAFMRRNLAIEWLSPKAEDLPQSCQIGGANVFPWGPFWLVDTAVPDLSD